MDLQRDPTVEERNINRVQHSPSSPPVAPGDPPQVAEIDYVDPEKQVQESEYRSLVKARAQIFWKVLADGSVEDAPTWRAYTGQSREQIKGWGWMRAIHPDDRLRIEYEWQIATQNKAVFTTEYRLRRYDGVYRLFSIQGIPVFRKDGSIRAWVGASTDITEQKQLQDELQESEQRFRATFEQAAVGIAHVSLDGRWLLVNQKFCDIVGYSCEDLHQATIEELLLPAEIVSVTTHIKRIIAGEISSYLQERHYTRADGSPIWVKLTMTLARDASKAPSYFIVLAEDITERKRIDQLMDEFLCIASHELKTPITTISAHIQMAERILKKLSAQEEAPEPGLFAEIGSAQDMIRYARRQTKVLNRLISDLIDISRIQVGKLELRLCPEPCDLATIVWEVVHNQRQVASPREIRLKMPGGMEAWRGIPPTTPYVSLSANALVPVVVDSDRLGQVLTNYLTNALKYSPADRPVEVTLQLDATSALVSVRDEGPGLSPEVQEHIWERFYRVGSEEISEHTHPHVGLGLGLYISKSIIERHQGKVGVSSTSGEGSTFWFTLPLAPRSGQSD